MKVQVANRIQACWSITPDSTREERATPIQAQSENAVSFGKAKNRLGDSRKRTCLMKSGTGSNPRSPSNGLNWFTALRKAMTKRAAIDFSSAYRATQYPPGSSHRVNSSVINPVKKSFRLHFYLQNPCLTRTAG